jgi:peptidoglycan/xylan/chitin deacetylase (PgdA/CDA1 family)
MHINRSILTVSVLMATILIVAELMAAPGSTTICLVKDNKKSAVVFTTDDGLLKSVKIYVAEWKKLNLRGTCAIIAGSVSTSEWGEWKKLVDEGYLDLGNHSMNHPNLTTQTWAQLETEVNGAKDVIEKNMPGYKVVTFLCPEGAYNDLVISKAMERHGANRVVDRGYNSFNPTVAQIYRLKRQQILGATTVDEMNSWVNQAISQGQWLIEAYHGCDAEGWEPPPCALLLQHYGFVATKLDQIWNGTFNQVIKYIKERQASTLKVVSASAIEIVLQLTDTLDNTAYNFPLTLKTEVNSAWSNVYLRQGAATSQVTPVLETGIKYAYFNVIPDGGAITLSANVVANVNPGTSPGISRDLNAAGNDDIVTRVFTLGGKEIGAVPNREWRRNNAGMNSGIYVVVGGANRVRCVFIP